MRKLKKDTTMRPVVVCDIDGTIARVGERRLRILAQENPDWDEFYKDPFDDAPNEYTCGLVRHLAHHYRIVFCTSRRDSVRERTEDWLRRHLQADSFVHGYDLLMRRGCDPRPDTAVKPELLRQWRARHHGSVMCVLEDSADMQEAWQNLGYTCVKVA